MLLNPDRLPTHLVQSAKVSLIAFVESPISLVKFRTDTPLNGCIRVLDARHAIASLRLCEIVRHFSTSLIKIKIFRQVAKTCVIRRSIEQHF